MAEISHNLSTRDLDSSLRHGKEAGRKLLVCYITGGLDSGWLDMLHLLADSGADAVEIGIPFSDPVMDGPVIQQSSMQALANGATPLSILSQVEKEDPGIPLAVMTYYNLVYRMGEERFAERLIQSGITGAILPDLPLDESSSWIETSAKHSLSSVLLAAPTTREDRLVEIAAKSRGFVYAVGLLGVTGEREELSESASVLAASIKRHTDTPVLVGVGISTPEQAKKVCQVADGVVVGSALVRRILENRSKHEIGDFIKSIREALD